MKSTLSSIQALRGIAAMMVVFFHAAGTVSSPKYWNTLLLGGLFDVGGSGVALFFVISGFIILWVHGEDIGKPRQLPRYAYRRLVRIYPVYWIVLAGVTGLYVFGVGSGADLSIANLASSALLVGSGDPPLVVAWTLYHEMIFYLVFGLLIVTRVAGLAVFGIWFIACFLGLPGYVAAPANLLFFAGMAVALLAKRQRIPAPRVLAAAGTIAFFVVSASELGELASALLQGIAGAGIILGAIGMERAQQFPSLGIAKLIGDASYSIYLVHVPVISVCAKLLTLLPPWPAFSALVLASAIVGIGFHKLVEAPILELARRRRTARAQKEPAHA